MRSALLLGGLVAGALGWYFDTAQLHVVIAKFWAYADVNYRLDGRQLGDFNVYPLFNKYGQVNLGEVAGGVRLFYAESLSGVINWSIAAPLFGDQFRAAVGAGRAQPAADQGPVESRQALKACSRRRCG